MKISIKRGLNIRLAGAPTQKIRSTKITATVGTEVADFPGVRAEALVGVGDKVMSGTPLFRDRRRADICFTAPRSGTVTEVVFAPRRRLVSVSVTPSGDEHVCFDIPSDCDREQVQRLMLESGLWPAFRSRPFGRIPEPGSAPDTIFITALDTNPHAVDARLVIDEFADSFAHGARILKALTPGRVFVCQAPGPSLVGEDAQLCPVQFAGPHPAGLAGTHIDRLFPLGGSRTVWQIHYQDVISLGRLVETGKLHADRVVALAGPGVREPRLVRVPSGADLHDLVAGEMEHGDWQVVSGPPISGRERQFLGRHHWQVSVPARRQATRHNRWFGLFNAPSCPCPVVPSGALDNALGPNVPVVPLIRALSVGDGETAMKLGCLRLLEEDMALVNYVTGGIQDFSILLRDVLNMWEEAR